MSKKSYFIFSFFLFCVWGYFMYSQSHVENINRVIFRIDPKDRQIVLPVQLNDSIIAYLGFDTGGQFILDSTFSAAHPSIMANIALDTMLQSGSGWATSFVNSSIFLDAPKVKVGNTALDFNATKIYDWRSYMNSATSVGMFNIPSNDSTHIWELNFEQNYLEVHFAKDFSMPKDCLVLPLVKKKGYDNLLFVALPIKVTCEDGNVLTMNRLFMIDTGMAWDVAIMREAEEIDSFNKQKNVVWTKYLGGYHRYCNVNAMLPHSLTVDSLRIYTFDSRGRMPSHYLIGQNFLKRFNVFFDMEKLQIGFQPIANFHRIVNPLHKRFHLSIGLNQQKKWIVTKVADYSGNYYKIAGIQEGDEVIGLNGRQYSSYTRKDLDMLENHDTLVYDVLRNGQQLRLTVVVNKEEVQGD